MLLHCYPYHRQAAVPTLPARLHRRRRGTQPRRRPSAAILAERSRWFRSSKMLYSSNAFGLAELHYLAPPVPPGPGQGHRRVMADGAWSATDGGTWPTIGSGNAAGCTGWTPRAPGSDRPGPSAGPVRRPQRGHRPRLMTPSRCAASCTPPPTCPGPSSPPPPRRGRARRAGRAMVAKTGRVIRSARRRPGGRGRAELDALRSSSRPACRGRRGPPPCTPAGTTCTWPR